MSNLVLDTHVFLWLLEGNPKLPVSLRHLINDPTNDLYLPALAVAELVDLIGKGRSPLNVRDLEAALQSDLRLTVIAMSEEIALRTARFIALLDIHDRCIVATTAKLIETLGQAVLVTRDQTIRDSGLVATIWG